MSLFGKGDWLDGRAVVTRERPTNTVNGDRGEGISPTSRIDELELNVGVQGREPYAVAWRGWVPLDYAGSLENQTLPVKVHPKKPEKIAPQWDDFQPAPVTVTVGGAQSAEDVQRALAAAGISIAQSGSHVTITRSAAAVGGTDLADRLAKLGQLKEQGLLTEDEFAAQKQKLLGG